MSILQRIFFFLKWLVKCCYFPQPLRLAQCPSLTKKKRQRCQVHWRRTSHVSRRLSSSCARGLPIWRHNNQVCPSTCLRSESDDGQTFERFFPFFGPLLDSLYFLLGCWLFCTGNAPNPLEELMQFDLRSFFFRKNRCFFNQHLVQTSSLNFEITWNISCRISEAGDQRFGWVVSCKGNKQLSYYIHGDIFISQGCFGKSPFHSPADVLRKSRCAPCHLAFWTTRVCSLAQARPQIAAASCSWPLQSWKAMGLTKKKTRSSKGTENLKMGES